MKDRTVTPRYQSSSLACFLRALALSLRATGWQLDGRRGGQRDGKLTSEIIKGMGNGMVDLPAERATRRATGWAMGWTKLYYSAGYFTISLPLFFWGGPNN